MKTKWIISLLTISILFLAKVSIAQATSGCCSWHGGESYCDYSTNRWVCNDGSYSPTCTCGGGYQAPAYIPTPTCPLNSYYNGSSCKCYSGYISNGSSCISVQQNCWNTLGYSSVYNYSTGQCGCSYGYVFSGGSCISGSSYCWNNYGYNSKYDSLGKKCACNYGYVWNSAGSSCISEDESCHSQLGLMSNYNSLDNTCDCLTGYTIQAGQCMPERKTIYIPAVYRPTPTPTPIPNNTYHKQNDTSTPTVTAVPSLTPAVTIKNFKQASIHKPTNFWDWITFFLFGK